MSTYKPLSTITIPTSFVRFYTYRFTNAHRILKDPQLNHNRNSTFAQRVQRYLLYPSTYFTSPLIHKAQPGIVFSSLPLQYAEYMLYHPRMLGRHQSFAPVPSLHNEVWWLVAGGEDSYIFDLGTAPCTVPQSAVTRPCWRKNPLTRVGKGWGDGTRGCYSMSRDTVRLWCSWARLRMLWEFRMRCSDSVQVLWSPWIEDSGSHIMAPSNHTASGIALNGILRAS